MKTLILGFVLLFASITQANAYVTVNPSSMEFFNVKIGSSASQMFVLNNFGNENVYVQSCMVFGAFECQMNCYGILFPGQSCMGTILFYPVSENYEFETVSIQTNDGVAMVSVHGLGVK